MHMRCFAVSLLAFMVPLGAVAQPIQPLEPVATELLEMRAPALSGWVIRQKTQTRVTFARAGFGPDGTLAAMAIAFAIKPPQSKEHFLAQIQAGIEADTPADRFRKLQFDLAYEETRGYPCARYTAIHEDRNAKTIAGETKALRMQTHSLYCIYPYAQGAAFVAAYSHRGQELYEGLEVAAREFIESVKARAR